MEKGFYVLKIDEEFRSLIRPLRRDEYLQLEVNLEIYGCLNPINTWRGFIIDGHNRYEICNRKGIPYTFLEISLDSREDVIIWICNNQLGRRNLTEETRKYLIGRKYASEKAMIRNRQGYNQYQGSGNARKESGRKTAQRIGQQHHISPSLVQKYYEYSRALDIVSEKNPGMKPKILSGSMKISHANLLALSEMRKDEIKVIDHKLSETQNPYVRYSESRKVVLDTPEEVKKKEVQLPAIKQMPKYDPDADAAGLTLTIPSWISSIERIKTKTNLEEVSDHAKENLKKSLYDLQQSIKGILEEIKENSDE